MEHTPENIWLLIARKLSGEATALELHELDELLRLNPDAGYSKEVLNDLWQSQLHPDRQYSENRYKELVKQIKNMGIDEGKFTQDDEFINGEEELQVKSSKKKWLLILSTTTIAFAVIAFIFYLQGTIDYSSNLENKLAKNQITTKNGSKTNLVLPDGTRVWLNCGSEITYDKNYGNKLREITLTGEAYFDVVKNADKPFLIHTSKMDIKVLGTAFNVKCYPGEKTTETSLIRGSIEVTLKDRQEKIMMMANEKLVISNEELKNEKILKEPIAVTQSNESIQKPIISLSHLTFLPADSTVVETAWVQNRFVFSSETFEDVALKMERWYSVKILFTDESLKTKRFTGIFEKESAEEALNAMQLIIRFSYSKSNNVIYISKYNNRLNK